MFILMGILGALIWTYIYPIISYLLCLSIYLLPRSSRTYQWLLARKSKPSPSISITKDKRHVIFFCPSLGEYENAKAIISWLTTLEAPPFIEICFFSPSGYVPLQHHYQHNADLISYSPIDTPQAVRLFFESRQVHTVIFSTLVLWPCLLNHLIKHNIRYSFISVRIATGWIKKLFIQSFANQLKRADRIITIDDQDEDKLTQVIRSDNITCLGDPRIDGIITQQHRGPLNNPLLPQSSQPRVTLIYASTHISDEEIILPLLGDQIYHGYRVIIAPHEISRVPHLAQRLTSMAHDSQLYSSFDPSLRDHVVIIDSIGLLKSLYSQCDVAYIGGGFGPGLHNIAEPILANCYTIVGPKMDKSYLALQLSSSELLKVVHTSGELAQSLSEYVSTSHHNKVIADQPSNKVDPHDEDKTDADDKNIHMSVFKASHPAELDILKRHIGAARRIAKVIFDET